MAVKNLNTSGAPPNVEAAFLKEIQILQLAAGTCQRACCMLGCCKLDGDPCIVMSLYPKSAARLLEDHTGQPTFFRPICEASKLLFLPPFQVVLNCMFVVAHLPAPLHIVRHIVTHTISNGALTVDAGPVPTPELVSLAVEVLEGLAELH